MTEQATMTDIAPELRVSRAELSRVLKAHWPELPDAYFDAVADYNGLFVDSRKIRSGDVFIAREGSQQDGHYYIPQALDNGAGLVLLDEGGLEKLSSLAFPDSLLAADGQLKESLQSRIVALTDLDSVLMYLIQTLADIPASLDIMAVTGTNGKSSVTHYIAALSEHLGHSTGLMGTLGVGRLDALQETGLTTPDPLAVAGVAKQLAEAGCERLALEASSHALDQGRLDPLEIRTAIFTNLTRDHLDYHGSMLAYAAAKAKLFQRKTIELAVVNADDDYAALMTAGLPATARCLRVGGAEGDFRVLSWVPEAAGQKAHLLTPEGERELRLSLMGRFNLDNILLAIAALYGRGESLDKLLTIAERIHPVAGRMERLDLPNAPLIVVDYAHTPDALENALGALHDHVKGNLWCIVGCGGDRDTGKRPLMAEVGARRAQYLVITDDNPRTEDPAAIRAQMITGVPNGAVYEEVAGRQKAIEDTIAQASADDLILIAGKGHENYQDIRGVRHPFSDLDIARQALTLRSRPSVHEAEHYQEKNRTQGSSHA